MALISVVMPAYNAEKYISVAIESVINQTFSDWELIIVDDCSTDATYQIAYEYTLKENRIKLYKLERNTGYAYFPRKRAIEKSSSDWIVNLDADDYISNTDLEKLYNRVIEVQADIVLHRLVRVDVDGKVVCDDVCPAWSFDLTQVLTGKEACMLTINSWTINGNGLFRKSIFEYIWSKYKEEFVGMNTDELLTRLLFLNARNVAFCDAEYYYRINPLSISNCFSIKLFHVLKTNSQLKDIIVSCFGQNTNESKLMELQIWNGLIYSSISYVYNINKILEDDRKKIEEDIYQSWKRLNWSELRYSLGVWKYLIFGTNYKLFMFLIILRKYARKIKHL